ncbi:MAG: succinyl-diaminopimelate desuccinylase [Thermoleophilaceae bacterium]|nr:succinyl-diaminopimelate desuccinylase [Thermoleophilaceae bacterium]
MTGRDPGSAAAEWVRGRGPELLDYAGELIAIPTDNPPGDCTAAAEVAAAKLSSLGLTVERHDSQAPEGFAIPTVLGWLGPRTMTPELVLNAHLDASPPTPEWTEDPYGAVRRDGRIYGRGAALSKSDVAAYTYGVAAAAAVLEEPAGTVLVAITSDEGSGGDRGPRALLEQYGLQPRRAITAGPTHGIGIAHNGALQVRLTFRGRAAHQAAVPPEQEAMRHAVAVAAALIREGDRLRGIRCDGAVPGIGHPTLNVTRLSGGQWLGLAPGTVEMLIDRRVTPDEDFEAAEEHLRRLIAELVSDAGASAEVEMAQRALPLRPTPESEDWARAVQSEAEQVLGEPVPLRGVPLYTDARWFGQHGVPTVLFGAGADDIVASGANGQDENVAEADVLAASEVVARVAALVASRAEVPA